MSTSSASSAISAASTTAAAAADHSSHVRVATAIYSKHKTASKQLHQAQLHLLATIADVDDITAELERAKASAASAATALTVKRNVAAVAELEFNASIRSTRRRFDEAVWAPIVDSGSPYYSRSSPVYSQRVDDAAPDTPSYVPADMPSSDIASVPSPASKDYVPQPPNRAGSPVYCPDTPQSPPTDPRSPGTNVNVKSIFFQEMTTFFQARPLFSKRSVRADPTLSASCLLLQGPAP